MPLESHDALLNAHLKTSLEKNLESIRAILNVPTNRDVVLRAFRCVSFSICAVYIDGMAKDDAISECILRASKLADTSALRQTNLRSEWLKENVIEVAQCQCEREMQALIDGVLGGMTALIVDGCDSALLMDTRAFVHRPVGKPTNESVVIGAQEGFVESLRDNITLLRRYVHSGELITERLSVGTGIQTSIALMYIRGVADEKILAEARRRLNGIQASAVQGVGGIQQLIEDSPRALFPQMLQTERPDRAASFLLEGQFVILAENSPYALTAPITLFHLLHTSDDMFMRWQYATFLRVVRILGVLISLLLPGLYVALTTHHTHLVPVNLLLSIAKTRADVPFSVLMEVLLMEFSFYLINEAGTRIPSQIGSTISIVGALILGQAAVSASIISPILIIVVAITGLGSYAVPNYGLNLAITMYRLLIVFAGAFLGLYGIMVALIAISIQLSGLHSFGIPYLAPVAPHRRHNPDIFLRLPLRKQKREMFFTQKNSWLYKEKRG